MQRVFNYFSNHAKTDALINSSDDEYSDSEDDSSSLSSEESEFDTTFKAHLAAKYNLDFSSKSSSSYSRTGSVKHHNTVSYSYFEEEHPYGSSLNTSWPDVDYATPGTIQSKEETVDVLHQFRQIACAVVKYEDHLYYAKVTSDAVVTGLDYVDRTSDVEVLRPESVVVEGNQLPTLLSRNGIRARRPFPPNKICGPALNMSHRHCYLYATTINSAYTLQCVCGKTSKLKHRPEVQNNIQHGEDSGVRILSAYKNKALLLIDYQFIGSTFDNLHELTEIDDDYLHFSINSALSRNSFIRTYVSLPPNDVTIKDESNLVKKGMG